MPTPTIILTLYSVCVCRIHTLTIRSCVPSGEMMVPLSPTSDGRVWDIQLVTIAMVLSTAPIFNMGTLILPWAHSRSQKKGKWGWLSHTVQTVDSSHGESIVTGRRSACSRVFSSTFSCDFTLLLMSALLQRTASGYRMNPGAKSVTNAPMWRCIKSKHPLLSSGRRRCGSWKQLVKSD